MYSFHQEKSNTTIPPEEIAKLLRSVGASGRLVGFNYIVYIVYNILQKPDEHYWITKCAYPETNCQGLFNQIYKKFTSYGLHHEAYA